jgi:tripartite-type tricarboxylate transporter receptor subunit TctC
MNARMVVVASVAFATGFIGTVHPQSFPSKSVRIIVPFPPGGAADITSRVLAEHMRQGLGQPMIIENRPGGGAVIGYELAARASDGHTMLVVFPSFVINPSFRRVAYDPIRDFKAVGQASSLPMAIAVSLSVPAKSLAELIALARAKPGSIAYGTPGIGTTHHVWGEMFRLAAGIDIAHAPYQGGGPAITAAAGGHLPMVIGNVTEIGPSAKSGKVRAIVVTTGERDPGLPDVPTIREAGYPALEATNWSGYVVPAATPQAAVSRLSAELVRALRSAEVEEKFKAQGMSPTPGTPEQFAAFLQSEQTRYAKVVREAGVKAD